MSKKIQLVISFVLLLGCISAIFYNIHTRNEEVSINKGTENADIYHEFLQKMSSEGKAYYYSFVKLSGYEYPILLLSDSVYKDNHEREVAMCTDVYYPVNNEVILFGNICSYGTAYPVSASTTGIFSAGGHQVAKYQLDMQSRKLKLIHNYIMDFYKDGEKVNSVSMKISDDENKIVTEKEFDQAYDEYADAKTVYFKPLGDQK